MLNNEAHKRYLSYFLTLLPTRLQSQDSNKLLLVYFAVCGLDLIGYIFDDEERKNLIEFIYLHLVDDRGFRGSLSHKLEDNKYDPPNLSAIYSALCVLTTLDDDLSRLNKDEILKYVLECQEHNGSFSSYVIDGKPIGDGDLRQCYLAASIVEFLKLDINLNNLEEYIINSIQFDGGLGSNESHAGLTFCGLAALKLIGSIEKYDWEKTIYWLVKRQINFNEYNSKLLDYEFTDIGDIGSFNGRENKYGDTCYSFWVLSSLKILNSIDLIDKSHAKDFLLTKTQSKRGGFSKTDIDDPDPLHTYLGICALSLLNENDIGILNEVLVIPL